MSLHKTPLLRSLSLGKSKLNLYKDSWLLYKAHSDFFHYDYEYYTQFSQGYKTLEAFAGYGRLTNILKKNGINIYANEISPEFANSINLPPEKIHIGNFLDFNGDKFERVIIAYNSFCLITEEDLIKKMFSTLENILTVNGRVSLSYYHPNNWHDDKVYPLQFNQQQIMYSSKYNLSNRKSKKGSWQDIYTLNNSTVTHDYELRIYENSNDLLEMTAHTRLHLVGEIKNYNNPEISNEGWIEYVLEKY